LSEYSVDLDAQAFGFVDSLCGEQNLNTEEGNVCDDRGRIQPNSVLRDVCGVLKFVDSLPTSEPPPGAQDPQQPIVIQAPAAAAASAKFDPSEPKHSYAFVYDDNEFTMDVPDRATVADTKQLVAERFSSLAENVKLLHCGKEMKDALVLSKQRIRPPNRIVVYIRSMDAVLLQSICPGRTAVKPPDYMDRLQQLVQATGQDARICARAFAYFEYNYERALEELQQLA